MWSDPIRTVGYSIFLRLLHGASPNASHVKAMHVSLVLYAEHEFNASTFTARTIASTGSDIYSSVTGAIGALLRREGLYSSHLVTWRRERQAGILKGLTPHKRGPKSKRNPQEEEMQKLRRENQRLTEELRKAEIVIDVQKKVGALLGWPLPKADAEEKP